MQPTNTSTIYKKLLFLPFQTSKQYNNLQWQIGNYFLQATRSEIFRTALSSDECKAPANDIISLPELSHDELQCLLEFLYCGTLKPDERADTHACSLLIAADKYNIPFLKKFCEDRILQSLAPYNTLQVLEVADTCSNVRLKEHAMNIIVKHMEDVVLSTAYDSFAIKNGHLSVEITRALLTEMKKVKTKDPVVELGGAMNTNNLLTQSEADLDTRVWI